MHLAPVTDHDPTAAIARAATQAALQALGTELLAATHAARDAADAAPMMTLDWLGPASDAFSGQVARLHSDAVGVRDALGTAARIVATEPA